MPSKRIDLPPGVLQPREAVLNMAPYSPPTARPRRKTPPGLQREHGRRVAQSHRISARASQRRRPRRLSRVQRDQARAGRSSSASSRTTSSSPTAPTKRFRFSSTPTLMTATKCLLLQPSYAMYRFYAEVAGASIREIPYRAREAGVPARRTACSHPSHHARHPDRQSRTIRPAPEHRARASNESWRRPRARRS